MRLNSIFVNNLRIIKKTNNCNFRFLSAQVNTQRSEELEEHRTDSEWINAKPFSEIPGPSKWIFPLSFMPGGELHNTSLLDLHRIVRDRYGDIILLKGIFGKFDTVFTYNPTDFEKTYRTEGVWPIRLGLSTFTHYRKKIRPEIFKNIGGLISEQGQGWAEIRNKVNPVLMKVETVKHNLPQINDIADELIEKINKNRDTNTNEMTKDFTDELRKWAFESISMIALNKRLELITSENPHPDVLRLVDAMTAFFQLSYEFDVMPSFWKYYETPSFKKLIATYDTITDITTKFIDEATQTFQNQNNSEPKSVLEKLCRIDKQIAMVMAMDMLMAGIDTTSSALTTILYLLAKNPEKQENLRKELMTILPEKNTPLTVENTKRMPYLRACIKESLRITPITPGNFRMAGQDIVLSGYQVPKGTGVLMGTMALSNDEKFFPSCGEFMPERWIKSGPDACPAAKGNNPFVYLPFGFGPRTCIGKRIAEMEMETLLAKLIRNYRVKWNTTDMKYISNLILIPDGEMKFSFENV